MRILEIEHIDTLELLLKRKRGASMKIFFLILGDLIRFVGKEENIEVKDTEKRDN